MKRVVITGLGTYSTIGKNLDEVRDSLYNGRSGIVVDPRRKEMGFRSALTGAVERPVLKGKVPRRKRVGLPIQGEYAYMSTVEAIDQARLTQEYFDNNEVGILFGNDSSAVPVIEAIDLVRERKDTTLLGSGSIFQSMNSTVSMNLSVIFRLKGINSTISAACASGAQAIGIGYLMIKSGLQDAIICGGAQEINLESMGSFDGLSAFSIREDDPTKASRPFDKSRDGLIPSGGAATVIIEDYDSAKKRGAPILGEVIGYGFSSDGEHISVPNVDGPIRAIHMALKNANISPNDIDYVNAHATSTLVGDKNEAQAIHKVFGKDVPVSSTKSMTGHEMWMGGASEIVYSLLMMHNSFIAPNVNFEEPDEASKDVNIVRETKHQNLDVILSNSFGFGGTNSTLIVKKLQE